MADDKSPFVPPEGAQDPSTGRHAEMGFLNPTPAAVLPEEQRTQARIIAWDAPWVTSYRYAPYNPDALISGKGYDELDKMLTMSAVSSAFTVLCDAVLFKNWALKPPEHLEKGTADHEQAMKMAEAATWHLHNIVTEGDVVQSVAEVVGNILLGVFHGFSTQEMQWRYVESGMGPDFVAGQYGWASFSYKRCKQIGFDLDKVSLDVRNLTNNVPYSGGPQIMIPVEKALLFTFRPINSLPYGRGIAREIYKHYLMLDRHYAQLAIAIQVHGIPHYRVSGPVADDTVADRIRSWADKVQGGASFVYPEGYTVELDQLNSGALESILGAIKWHTQQIYMAFLGQSLTTNPGEGEGSYALGSIHQNTQEFILKRVRQDVEWVMTEQALRRWTRYNYGDRVLHLSPRFSLGQWDAADSQMLAQSVSQMITSGVLYAGEPFIRELMGYPAPDPETEAKLEQKRQFEQEHAQEELDVKRQAANQRQQVNAKPKQRPGGDQGGETKK